MKIKITLRYDYTPIKNSDNIRNWQRRKEVRTFIYCFWNWKIAYPLWTKIWQFLQNLNTISMRPRCLILRCFPKRNESIHPHKDLSWNFHVALFIVVPNCK